MTELGTFTFPMSIFFFTVFEIEITNPIKHTG